jgi:hypothetical protein
MLWYGDTLYPEIVLQNESAVARIPRKSQIFVNSQLLPLCL